MGARGGGGGGGGGEGVGCGDGGRSGDDGETESTSTRPWEEEAAAAPKEKAGFPLADPGTSHVSGALDAGADKPAEDLLGVVAALGTAAARWKDRRFASNS